MYLSKTTYLNNVYTQIYTVHCPDMMVYNVSLHMTMQIDVYGQRAN